MRRKILSIGMALAMSLSVPFTAIALGACGDDSNSAISSGENYGSATDEGADAGTGMEGNDVPTIISSSLNGQTVNLLSGDLLEYVSNYAIDHETPHATAYCDGTDKEGIAPVTITWEAQGEAEYYTVKLSKNADLSNATSYASWQNQLVLEEPFMGTKYYYQIYAHYADRTVKSRVYDFTTAYQPRVINIEGGSNIRDIGGYYTEDGTKRLKQGIVYRGAQPEDFTAAGLAKFENVLGLKTDLDLRGHNTTPFSSNVNLISVSGPMYVNYNGIHFTNEYRDALAQEILAFANPANFPMYVHCTLGRDRTGTLTFLISALCGVGLDDLYLDYEIAWLSRWGSSGWNKQEAPAPKMGQFTRMINYLTTGTSFQDTEHDAQGYPVAQAVINNPYFTDALKNATLAEQVEAYILGHFASYGINADTIAAIRANMLEEV